MTMWVVYKNPKDYPDQFVVRRHHVMKDNSIRAESDPEIVSPDYETAVGVIPMALYRMQRSDSDDQSIQEVWL